MIANQDTRVSMRWTVALVLGLVAVIGLACASSKVTSLYFLFVENSFLKRGFILFY